MSLLLENNDKTDEIEDLKGQIKVLNLNLKDKEFILRKTSEDYEFQIKQSNTNYSNLKDKFEKINEAQKKLVKQNSELEDRLLKIVQKYEDEQKTLLEDLQIAHSQIVEAKLLITNLEKEKESFRQDCNIAVNLLQTKPGDFVKHSYTTLPVNLKDRLKSYLSLEDTMKLEEDFQKETDNELKKQNSSIFKIPIFQPTAAAAMMYNMQNVTMQQQQRSKQQQVENQNENEIPINNNNTTNSLITDTGKVSSLLIAQVLKKEADPPSRKQQKLLPYVCLRCRKESIFCSSPSQFDINDLNNDLNNSSIKHSKSATTSTNNDLSSHLKPIMISNEIDQNNEYKNTIMII